MKNCAFTIVAKNYVGLAQILEFSIRQYYNDMSFYIIIADEVSADLRKELPLNVLIAKECLGIDNSIWNDMSFKYDLTEFCTSIKPASFLYLFKEYDFEKVIYLDPDIYFYNSIGRIFEMLDFHSILLTPHITKIPEKGLCDSPENTWLFCGIYNLGFCGLRRSLSADEMLRWWQSRLVNECYVDSYGFLFTDQKWMDFLPSFFSSDDLHISHDLGMNMAPWNFYEREVFEESGSLYVRARFGGSEKYPLLFVHYSGYDYTALKRGEVVQKNISNLKKYSDINILTTIYAKSIKEQSKVFEHFISQEYSYNSFNNGDLISSIHRRLYRGILDKGENFANPFDSRGKFYMLLNDRKMLSVMSGFDKITKHNIVGIRSKLKKINLLTKIAFKLLGVKRYFMIIRLLRPYSRFESQIHLLNDKYLIDNIY